MSFIDDQFDDYFMQDALGFYDNNECEYDDCFLLERQKASGAGGVDWRYEKD